MRAVPQYAELRCLTNFSFLRGASQPEELVERAKQLGYAALAVADECSMAGIVRAHGAAKRVGLRLLVGSQFELDWGEASGDDAAPFTLTVLACNLIGYGNLCQFITKLRRASPKGSYQLAATELSGAELADCVVLASPRRMSEPAQLQALARWLLTHFIGRCWFGVELLRLLSDEMWLHRLREVSQENAIPLVACGDVHFHVRSRKPLQDVLTAIRLGNPLTDCGLELQPNAERHLRTRLRLAHTYPEDLLAETLAVAARCSFSLDELRYQYPDEVVPLGETPVSYLRRLTYEGAGRRWPAGIAARVQAQIEHELALIAELRYEHYFLTVADIVRFARSRHILCQGRGSAANSVVCYCLGVTEVDPARMSVLFERFISKERNEPPDIDIDFEHERREEVLQYLYARYGRERAALTAVVICYRPRSAIRDVGKALGFAAQTVDTLAKEHQWWDGQGLQPERLAEVGLSADELRVRQLIELTRQLLGFPRHLSQHVGGFVLTKGPLCRMVPIENAAMADRTVIQWDKDDLDALGLLKVDCLALGMLTAIAKALDFIGQRKGYRFEMQDIPAEDAETYEMVCKADTVGVFQIESRAQMSMLPRLQPRCFYDLVIEVAIIRPGPIQGGMVHPYLNRRQGKEPVSYPSEALKEALGRTLGVPVFQEQVMQIAMIAAGFTPGEADGLRRAMAAWKRKGGLDKYQHKLVNGMTARGYSLEFAESIYQQVHGFSEYGFPESHAASFALLVYASCWMKRHHPAEFLAAMLNSQPLGFYSPSQLVQDARRHGVEVRPVDVMDSCIDCTLEDLPHQPAVRLGLRLVAGLRQEAMARIVAAREVRVFDSAEDLARSAQLEQHEMKLLAAADALRRLSGHRRQQVWDAAALRAQPQLLREASFDEALLELPAAPEGEEILFDYAA
ncbi:MAG: error-prone DNA polymerase, partial [Proteobacteria bacterium]|nr:error-prone DNA polymerase [Pseudomonadota bacterium]